jgi:DNA-directed RNA polymerase subunit E'/Rpb7
MLKSTRQGKQTSDKKIFGVYIRSILTQKVILHIKEIGRNVKQNLEQKIVSKNEGRCITEGFIRPNSVKIISYSSGLVNSENIEFQTVFECMICHPIEGQLIECIAKTVTKAGIHAEVVTENDIVPVTVFIARDHHNTNKHFATIKENANLSVRVIGVRFELNDPYICVIGQLLDPSNDENQRARQKSGLSRLTVGGDYQEGLLIENDE